mmetsp:Transcript_27322/g.49391  ORF Transcript_27322/g.49391 Transcript_27322/m.49391 type:complete len:81 (+) Transcript_27322:491-733(+)
MQVSGVILTCLLPLIEKSIQRRRTFVISMAAKTGASLKITILNHHAGRIWTSHGGWPKAVLPSSMPIPFPILDMGRTCTL